MAATSTPFATATTGGASFIDAHDATLTGSIAPAGAVPLGSTARLFFQIGTSVPYELQSVDQDLPANQQAPVHASLTGLQSNRLYHYRLVAIDNDARMSVGADHTFMTAPEARLAPAGVELSVSPVFHFTLPVVVHVSGRVVRPISVKASQACRGFVDITFRVRRVAVQTLRAGLQNDCTYKLNVRFSKRRRLKGGHLSVHVLFPGNRVLTRRAANSQSIQIGY
jgi:hypothetical protein